MKKNNKNINFLQPENWFSRPTHKEHIEAKLKIFQAFSFSSGYDEQDNEDYIQEKYSILENLLTDFDILRFFHHNHYFHRCDYHLLPHFNEHISKIEHAQILLEDTGLVQVEKACFLAQPELLNREEKVFDYLIQHKRVSEEEAQFFSHFLTHKPFVLKLIEAGFESLDNILKLHEPDLELTRLAISRSIQWENFHPDIWKKENIEPVLHELASTRGSYFYIKLPLSVQENPVVCAIVAKHHPYTELKNPHFINEDNFFDFLEENKYYYSLCDYALKYVHALQTDKMFLRFIRVLSEEADETPIDYMAGPAPRPHTLYLLLTHFSTHFSWLKLFLQNDEGKKFIDNYQTVTASSGKLDLTFEQYEEMIPALYKSMESFYLYKTIDEALPFHDNDKTQTNTKHKI